MAQPTPTAKATAPARPGWGALDAIGRAAPALVVLLAFALGLRRLDNSDTWWHLAAGRWIVEHGRVPATDVLSYTVPDHPWVNVQWLFDVLIYGLHQLGGPSLLVVAAALAYAGAVALMLANVRRHLGAVGTAALGAWAVVVAQERFAIRPEMASYLLLQVVLWIYATGKRAESRRLWLLPAVMALWANLHSLFVVGAVIAIAEMAGTVAGRLPVLPEGWRTAVEPAVARRVLATGAAALLATIANPFGTTGALFPLVLMSRINGDVPAFQSIGEFKRPFSGYFVTLSVSAYQALVFVALPVVVTAVVLAALPRRAATAEAGRGARRRGRDPSPPVAPVVVPPRVDLADVAVFAGITYLSFLARRNIALFAMGAAPFLAACVALLRELLPEGVRRPGRALARGLGVLLPPALVASGAFVATNGFYRWNQDLHEFGLGTLGTGFPVRLAQFAEAQHLPPPLFNDFSNGGYLTWARPVPGGVFMDGRTEVYDVSFFLTYTDLVRDPRLWQEDMDRRGVGTVFFFHWWPNHQTLLRYLLHDARWALVAYDETSVVLVRRAGNEELVARATAAAAPLEAELAASLLEPVTSWQHPIARARALLCYADLLVTMGRGAEAARYRERFLEIGGSSAEEVAVSLALADFHAARGEASVARSYLARAAALDPANPGVARLSARLAH